MKKLILYDHLGIKQLELDVFVEGSDFEWEPIIPTAYWLGKILLVDKEPEQVETELERVERDKLAEATHTPELEQKVEPVVETSECAKCGEVVPVEELDEARLCLKCATVLTPREEVISEPETISDKGLGDKRSRKAK